MISPDRGCGIPLASALLTAILVAGCGGTAPLPDDHFYRLIATRQFAHQRPSVVNGIVLVERPEAVGVRDERAILYSRPPHVGFKQYHYQHWEDSPSRMLQRRMIEALRQANVADALLATPAPDIDYRLRTRIDRFERLLGEGRPAAVVRIAVRLIPVGHADEPLLDKVYEQRLDAESGRMDDTILAFSRAVDAVIAQLIEDLRA